MEVILLERVAKLGQMGETVRVRDGYARNFLLPGGKALRATESNKKRFEGQKEDLEKRNVEARLLASDVADKLEDKTFTIIRQAGESGYLYGSVSTRDIAEVLTAEGFKVTRNQVLLTTPIKALGLHKLPIQLHPEIDVPVVINVARSNEEAERQARGESIVAEEENTMDELGLEVGAALADNEGSFGDR